MADRHERLHASARRGNVKESSGEPNVKEVVEPAPLPTPPTESDTAAAACVEETHVETQKADAARDEGVNAQADATQVETVSSDVGHAETPQGEAGTGEGHTAEATQEPTGSVEVLPTTEATRLETGTVEVGHTAEATQEPTGSGEVGHTPEGIQEAPHSTEAIEQVIGPVEGKDPVEVPKKPRKHKYKPTSDVREENKISPNGPFPNGPVNNSLLKSFYNHTALFVFLGVERPPLKAHHHQKGINKWVIPQTQFYNYFISRLQGTGLHVLADGLPELCRGVISAMVERWQPETCSFHLPVGEMTITLDDVKQITGLPVEGYEVSCPVVDDMKYALDLVQESLGLPRDECSKELTANGNYTLKLTWIRNMVSGKMALREDTDLGRREVDCAVRGYILHSLGSNLFCDKTGNRVQVHWLRCLQNLDYVSKYAWGAAGLAYLYQALTDASRFQVIACCGYLGLLEVWAYEHFTTIRRRLAKGYEEPQPLMKKYAKAMDYASAEEAVVWIRQSLDLLTEREVIFDPYYQLRQSSRPIPPVAFYEGRISAGQLRSSYLPGRVMRQFGLKQSVPPPPPTEPGNNFRSWASHVISMDLRHNLVAGENTCEKGYLTWFCKYGHPRVQNPDRWVGPKANEDAPSASAATSSARPPSVTVRPIIGEQSRSAALWEKNWPLIQQAYEKMDVGIGALSKKRNLSAPYKVLCEARDMLATIVSHGKGEESGSSDNDDEGDDSGDDQFSVKERTDSQKSVEPTGSGSQKKRTIEASDPPRRVRSKSTRPLPAKGKFSKETGRK